VRGHQIKRKLQINEPELLAAAAAENGAEPVEHLCGTGLRGVDERRKLFARLELGHCLDNERMPRQGLVERGKDLERLSIAALISLRRRGGLVALRSLAGLVALRTLPGLDSLLALAREKAAIALHQSQHGWIGLIGALEALGRLLPLTRKVQNHRCVHVLEKGIPVGARELVDGISRRLHLAGRFECPRREQRRREIGDRSAHRLGQLLARRRILLLLERTHTQNEPRNAVVLVRLQDTLGKPHRLVDLAICEHRKEGHVEQVIVAGIAAQGRAVVGSCRRSVTLAVRVSCGQIAARR